MLSVTFKVLMVSVVMLNVVMVSVVAPIIIIIIGWKYSTLINTLAFITVAIQVQVEHLIVLHSDSPYPEILDYTVPAFKQKMV